MQLTTIKALMATVWMSAVLIAGLTGAPNSPSRWAVLASFAIFPPIVMAWRLNAPGHTLPLSIQAARR